ncbi:MAG TPA: efflux RND transporter permease subunit, partial [Gemmatimonadales bacterium]
PNDPVAEVIRRGTDEIFAPVLSSTITTVVVFTPLGLVEGVVGQFFKAFSIALAIAVALSLLLAVTVIPLLAEWWLARGGGAANMQRRWRDPLERVLPAYRRLLEWIMARRRVALVGVVVLLGATLGLYRVVGSGFLPDMDEGGFILDYWAPPTSSLPETDRQVGLIEAVLKRDPAVQAFSRRTGTEMGMFATAPNRGDITVLLKPRHDREATVYEVMDRVRDTVNQQVPAVRVEFVQLLQDNIGDLAGAPEPIELKLFTADQAVGESTAVRIAAAVDSVDGLVDLFNGVPGDNVETRVDVDPVRAARLGLTPADVVEQAEISVFGREVGSAREADRLVPIRVHLSDAFRANADVAASVPIVGPANWAPLGMVGRVRDTTVASELLREDLRPVIKVTGRNEDASLGDVMRDIRERIDTMALPPGVRLEYGGQYAAQQASFRQLLLVSALAVGAVLLVMVIQFREVRGPVGLVLAAPLGLAGALAGLAITRIPFNVASFMGLILLIGLVVKNGILLIDAAHALRNEGRDAREALIEAATIRLRPILMTTLCTVAGLFPLALGLGAGAELQRPLAVAVIGGLSVSTVVTLLLLPVGLDAAKTFSRAQHP